MVGIYKLIGDGNIFKPLETVLKNRGIKDIERFLNPSKEDVIHYSKLKNINKAVELFDRHKGGGSAILVLVDPDCD